MSPEQLQAAQNGCGRLPDHFQRHPAELIQSHQLVEVEAEQLEDDAGVVAEDEVVEHPNDVRPFVSILGVQQLQHPDLLLRLTGEPVVRVADDLDGDVEAVLVVEGLDHLAEAALAEHLEDLVPVGDLVVYDRDVEAFGVVKIIGACGGFIIIWRLRLRRWGYILQKDSRTNIEYCEL